MVYVPHPTIKLLHKSGTKSVLLSNLKNLRLWEIKAAAKSVTFKTFGFDDSIICWVKFSEKFHLIMGISYQWKIITNLYINRYSSFRWLVLMKKGHQVISEFPNLYIQSFLSIEVSFWDKEEEVVQLIIVQRNINTN